MNSEYGEGCREDGGAKGEVGRRGLHDGRAAGVALTDHGDGGLHGDHRTVRGLVGSRAGADVDDAISVAEGAQDRGREAWIGSAIRPVAPADLVEEGPPAHVSIRPLMTMLSVHVRSIEVRASRHGSSQSLQARSNDAAGARKESG
jgi:hypothetical protein